MSSQRTAKLELRASDVERERASSILRTNAAEGRLDMKELEDRLGVAYSARTRSELDALLEDLPHARSKRPRDFPIHRAIYLWVIAGMVLLWAIGGSGYFWPMWPAFGWGIGLLAHGSSRGACRSRRH
jgi:hypothetical protein